MILISISLFYFNGILCSMKYSELERKLKKAGCHYVRDGKKHPIWFSPITEKEFQTSHHKSEEVKFGTLQSILRDSGLKK